MELIACRSAPPLRLLLQCSEGSEVALHIENHFDAIGSNRTDELILQVPDANMESQPRHVGRRSRVADTGICQAAAKGLGFARIAEAGQASLTVARA